MSYDKSMPTPTNTHPNTPRTRNRVMDNTPSVKAPEGYTGERWTLRKKIEADFRALGFRSNKFSHKNEPEHRTADSLWLSWTEWGKDRPNDRLVDEIEVRVTFFYGETTFKVTHTGRGRRACYSSRLGSATFVGDDYSTADVMAHIDYLLFKTR